MAHRHPCPFFGKSAVPLSPDDASRGSLIPSGGNQCALVTESFRPCYLEVRGDPPELEACEWNHSARAHQFANYQTVELKGAPDENAPDSSPRN